MAYSNLKTDYTDAVYSGLKKYMMITNEDGTVSFQDVTNYTNKENSFFSANDANQINSTLNNIMAGNTDVVLKNDIMDKAAIGKFLTDINRWRSTVTLKSHIVNNTTSTRTDMPLAANQGKVLSGRINPLEIFLAGKTYRQFAAKPSDWLGSGMISVATVDISGSKFSNCPPTRSGSLAYYIVVTIGVSDRCIQLAFYGFSGATVDKGSIFFRRQHDTGVSPWMKVM